ncbi:AraC family transcriptional regulator [Paenibacillus mendelii]|uniref:AraC family transcriptional regulator n=1 Tax=Paenibacillus mendelii TaxID=206163 RepID=A0ABV6JEY5_9BACL|nr:helix-turn-helix domain-containing protein [Paenibacillus mendelii]MCQ6557354.1 AraC family transcriptional regulator [Paenibacillus mendelii]
MNIIQLVEAIHINHSTNPETGIALVPWTLATIPEIPHWHYALEICYCLSGRGAFYFKDREYEIRPGDLIIVNNVERHTSKSYRGETCSNLFLFFNASTLEQTDFNLLRPFFFDRNQFSHKISADLPVARQIGRLIQDMQDELAGQKAAYGQIVKSLLFHICSLLLRHYHVEGDAAWHRMYNKYTTLKSGLNYIQTHYQENISLDDVSKAMSLSSSRARHLFTEVMGEGYKTYLTQFRVQAAQRMLTQTELTVTEIYEQCGFQSSSSFYRDFQRLTNLTPLQYIKKYSPKRNHTSDPL